MNEFNISPEYKKYRQRKKKRAAKIHKIKIISAICVFILIAAGLVALLIAKFAPEKNNEETKVPSLPTENTATATKEPEVYVPTILIHPGHGALLENGTLDTGVSNGSAYYDQSNGKTEGDLTLEIALKLQEALSSLGYNAILTREYEVDHTLTDTQVCNIIKQSKVDLVISIHGRSDIPSSRGAFVIYSEINSYPALSQSFALSVANAIDAKEGQIHVERTQVITSDLNLLMNAGIPAIQIEPLNLTNLQDAKLGTSQAWQEKFTYTVASAIQAQLPIENSGN